VEANSTPGTNLPQNSNDPAGLPVVAWPLGDKRQPGWGLIQWTPSKKVVDIAAKASVTSPIHELQTQLDLVWWHMTNTSPTGANNMLEGFRQTDLAEAVKYYELKMEGAGTKAYDSRIAAARLALKYSYSGAVGGEVVSASSGCQCTVGTNTTSASTVVLDPGHSGIDKEGEEVDPETGLLIGDSSNDSERKQAWAVAEKVKNILTKSGYRVIMTKKNADDYANLRQRAVVANEANAAIAVSIHTTGGKFGNSSAAWVTPQRVGGFRVNPEGKKTTFEDIVVAQKSQQYSELMRDARVAAGEKGTVLHDINLDGRTNVSPGNLPIVQLFSRVPWVYNETGQSGLDVDVYAKGIAAGVVAAVKPPTTTTQAYRGHSEFTVAGLFSFFSPKASAQEAGLSTAGCGGAVAGSVAQTAINYAWPTYRGRGTKDSVIKKSTYEAAIVAAKKAGKYTGDSCFGGGVDCGAFVTRVMQDSGADPSYGGGGNTLYQERHMREKSALYEQVHPKTTADLSRYQFAIAINDGHTYLYIGKHDGFETLIASASQCMRAPMAGKEMVADPSYNWFVLKNTGGSV
jgi:N-acetylmuramoyl-L-alanine amidase